MVGSGMWLIVLVTIILGWWSAAVSAGAPEGMTLRAGRPRLMDRAALARAQERIARGAPEAIAAGKWCQGRLSGPTLDASEGASDLSLCGLVFHRADPSTAEQYWKKALAYMLSISRADGKTALPTIQKDSGFYIRILGVALPVAYDRLSLTSSFTPDLRREMAEEMVRWVDWYEGKLDGKGGFAKTGPAWNNYYSGYFVAKTLIGIAIAGDHPRGLPMVEESLQTFRTKVVAEINSLSGGYPPEGWGYGGGLITRYVTVVDAFQQAGGIDLSREFPFMRNSIRALIHGMKPDYATIYDGGDWGGDKFVPFAVLRELRRVYSGTPEGDLATEHLLAAGRSGRDTGGANPLMRLLWDEPASSGNPAVAAAEPLAYLAGGTNLAMMRSSWRPDAVWAALQSGGGHFADHQNRDQGHLTIWYKGVDLLIDAGMWRESRPGLVINNFGGTTDWHNSILIDDKKEGLLTYPPGQGYWGRRSTRAFENGESYVFVSADITGAYAPPDWRPEIRHAVEKLTRDLVYIRPNHFVVVDRVRTAKDSYGKWLVFHFANAAEPTVAGAQVESRYGSAKIVIQSLLPEKVSIEKHRTLSLRCNNDPKCPSFTWRIQISPEGHKQDQVFLQLLVAADAGAPSGKLLGTPIHVEAGNAVGVLVPRQGGPVAVLVNPEGNGAGGPVRYTLTTTGRTYHLLFGMAPGGRYRVESASTADGLRISALPDPAGSLVATSAGVLGFSSVP